METLTDAESLAADVAGNGLAFAAAGQRDCRRVRHHRLLMGRDSLFADEDGLLNAGNGSMLSTPRDD
jgi:hypothetical protein